MLTDDPLGAKPKFSGAPVEVAPDVFMHPFFVNTYAMKTPVGLLLVDPGTRVGGPGVHAAIRAWSKEPVHTVVYTHGHLDHAFGLKPFLEEGLQPQIIAQENCPRRFERYALTHGYNEIINQRQFGTDKLRFPNDFDWPTLTFRDGMVQRMGDLELRYHAAKGETDDHCYIWIPQKKYLFCGDLIVWRSPNCGNPQKVQRYPIEWAQALEQMAALDAEWLFPGHGLVVKGRDAVRLVLTETAQYLRHIIDQVLPRLNAGQSPEEIFHAVDSDPVLAARPICSKNTTIEIHRAQSHPPLGRLVERQRRRSLPGDAGAPGRRDRATGRRRRCAGQAQPRPPCEGRSRTRLPCRGMGGASFT